jgi:hypothetical protein
MFPETLLQKMLIKKYSFSELGLTDNKINLNRFKWEGDYDSGRLIDIVTEKKSIVSEREVDVKYSSIFFGKYNNDLNTILYEIILNLDMKTENGKEMQNFLKTLLEKKKQDIEYYKSSNLHIFESNEDVIKRQRDAFSSTK